MFTGIIRHLGTVQAIELRGTGARIVVDQQSSEDGLVRGESVSVNGVCLTIIPNENRSFSTDVSPETLSRTTLGNLVAGARVNLERALALGDRLGGHMVQGHVDCVGSLVSIEKETDFAVFRWSYPSKFRALLVPKGSVTVDGISLTVVDPDDASFGAALIPETLERTNLRFAHVGDEVNLEFDILAKYAQRLMEPYLSR